MIEPRLLPCLHCRKLIAPKPGEELVCSTACDARLRGVVARFAQLLRSANRRDPTRQRS
jgi:hypothetical protein